MLSWVWIKHIVQWPATDTTLLVLLWILYTLYAVWVSLLLGGRGLCWLRDCILVWERSGAQNNYPDRPSNKLSKAKLWKDNNRIKTKHNNSSHIGTTHPNYCWSHTASTSLFRSCSAFCLSPNMINNGLEFKVSVLEPRQKMKRRNNIEICILCLEHFRRSDMINRQ